MRINKRLERLEREQSEAMRAGFWNFEKVSTEELIELRNLICRDPGKAKEVETRLIQNGLITYEFQK